mgnify:CR=1 FL=1
MRSLFYLRNSWGLGQSVDIKGEGIFYVSPRYIAFFQVVIIRCLASRIQYYPLVSLIRNTKNA